MYNLIIIYKKYKWKYTLLDNNSFTNWIVKMECIELVLNTVYITDHANNGITILLNLFWKNKDAFSCLSSNKYPLRITGTANRATAPENVAIIQSVYGICPHPQIYPASVWIAKTANIAIIRAISIQLCVLSFLSTSYYP